MWVFNMNLSSSQILPSSFLEIIKVGVLPLGILVIVAMMVLPLPPILLDLFFVSNILVSLLVLMVAMHTSRPLDFSSFPSSPKFSSTHQNFPQLISIFSLSRPAAYIQIKILSTKANLLLFYHYLALSL